MKRKVTSLVLFSKRKSSLFNGSECRVAPADSGRVCIALWDIAEVLKIVGGQEKEVVGRIRRSVA